MKAMRFAGIGAVAVVFGVVSAVEGAITLVGPNNPVLYVDDDCPGPCFCATFSNPITRIGAPGGPTSDFGWAMTTTYPGWAVTYGGAVNGTITVDKYRAYVCEYRTAGGSFKKDVHCMHGVELSMRFTPAPGEAPPAGQTAQWIQYLDTFDFFGNGCGRQFTKKDKFVDASSGNPPYYPGSAQSFYDSPQDGCFNYIDSCGQIEDFCPRPCWWGGNFQTYLAYGTAGNNTVGQIRVMEGVAWNFQATCVARPTPAPPPIAGTPVPLPGVPITVVPGGGGTPGNPGGMSFGDATVEVLNLDGSDVTDPAYAGDAMLGATISVTDFTFLAGGDGHYFFEGGHVSIHKDGIVFLEAELPILVVNDEWAADTGSNICAQYGDVQYNLGAGSDYIAAIADFDALPQTFGAFRACTDQPLEPLLATGGGGVINGSMAASFCLALDPTTLPGDANGNGFVDDDDLAILLANWEQDPTVLTDWSLGDFTDDTNVDDDDLSVLLGNWTGPPVEIAVPEPATLSLLALGGLAVMRRRRR